MRVLKKLFLGDVVAKGTTRQLRKLTTEEPTESIVGTWRFKDTVSLQGFPNFRSSMTGSSNYIDFNIGFTSNEGGYPWSFTKFRIARTNTSSPYRLQYNDSIVWEGDSYTSLTINTDGGYNDVWKTIVITEEQTDEAFKIWLKANATKQ